MIDQLRAQIQNRLDDLAAEADRLHSALRALDPDRSSVTSERKPTAGARPRSAPPRLTAQSRRRTSSRRAVPAGARSPRPPVRGATRASVLAALAGGKAMTAGEVAAKTGLGRATVSTTLSKLAGSGAVEKAQRGYRLTAGAGASSRRVTA